MAAQQTSELASSTSTAHGDVKDPCRLHVGALQPTLTRADVYAVFSPFGEIDDIELVRRDSKPLAFAFLQYREAESASMAVTHMNGFVLAGHKMSVQFAR